MPINSTSNTANAGTTPINPFIGPVNHTVPIVVPLSGLTTAEVDLNGYLKPGVALARSGALVGSGVVVYGVTVESIKVAASNSSADLAAGGSPEVAVGRIGLVNRKIMEDNLGRVLTAAEIAGFALAGSLISLVS